MVCTGGGKAEESTREFKIAEAVGVGRRVLFRCCDLDELPFFSCWLLISSDRRMALLGAAQTLLAQASLVLR